VTMGATLMGPTAAVLGFLVLTGVVVALGSSSTARYEFERNGTLERQRSGADGHRTHPAGSRRGRRPAGAADGQARPQARPQAVDLAVRPAPAPTTSGPGWWLIDEWAQALAGPFADRVDADWVALSEGLPAVSIHGIRGADGRVAPRPSSEERAWLGELGEQLDRLPADWASVLSDTDPLTTLVVEVAAALVEAGLPLQDAQQGHPAGGVCLLPEQASGGVLVSWRAHDRMSLHELRGAAAHATVQQSMNAAVADVLANLGFMVEPFGATGCSLVTALR
jgi:hypothetical protein